MSLLTPWVAVFAAAVAIPALLLLYFLKLRRREMRISSTLLWKRAVHDLQVNAPFQKLRKNLLLFLQLLVLAALLFGLGNPVANFLRASQRRIVVLIDRSGSMKTVEADGRTRLEHAKEAAADLVRDLPDDAKAMVIGFADRATVEATFTDDKRRLARQIEAIEPTDGHSRIGEALQLAVAYSSQLIDVPGMTTPQAATVETADIELLSDGRIKDAAEQAVVRGEMRYYRTGSAADNAGIVAFDVRREYDRPGVLSVFATVENFGAAAVKADLSLSHDGRLLKVEEIALGPIDPAATQPADAGRRPGEQGQPSSRDVIFSFNHQAGGVIEVRLHHEDALASDNVVTAPIDPPREVRLLAVSERPLFRRVFARALVTALELEHVDWMTPAEYEQAGDDALIVEGRSKYDLVLLDGHDTGRLPPGNYVFFGGAPKIDGVTGGERSEDTLIVSWQETHPLLRYVLFDNIHIRGHRRLTLPPHARTLVEGVDSPLLAMINDPGHAYVLAAFDPLPPNSDLPFEPSFIVLLQNTVRLLTASGLSETGRLIAPGETIAVAVPAGARRARITRPNGSTETADVADRPVLTYARTHDAGLYRFSFDDANETTEAYAANLSDRTESFVAPNAALSVGGSPIETVAGEARVNQPLWPYAVAAALLLLLVEWWVYNRRVMI